MTNEHDGDPSGAFLEELHGLKAASGWPKDKHAVATVLITACIERGIDTRARIVETLTSVGLNPNHVAIVLNENAGENPVRYRWRRDEQGQYSLHENERKA